MTGPDDSPARELGRALRDIRTSLPCEPGTVVSQTEVARRVLVGGKGAVSLFENGKRIPSAAVVRHYCALAGQEPHSLLVLRERAVAETRAVGHLDARGPLPSAAGPPPEPVDKPAAAPLNRRVVLVGFALAGAGAVGGFVAARVQSARAAVPTLVVVTAPHRWTDAVTTMWGTIHGLESSDLWIDVQALDDLRHHPTDVPCDRIGTAFSFDKVSVGTALDDGRRFRLSVLAVQQGGQAEIALMRHADRPRNTRHADSGLGHLPTGTEVVASVVVRRR